MSNTFSVGSIGAAISLTLLCVGTGCGNLLPSGVIHSPGYTVQSLSSKSSSSVDSFGNDSNYECDGLRTVVPQRGTSTDGSGYYSVCPSVDATQDWNILLHGKTVQSGTVCVFPSQTSFSGGISWIKDPNTGRPAFLCAPTTASGAYYNFPSLAKAKIGFNSVIVIEAPEAPQMLRCIEQNFSYCPDYSFGKFR